MLSMRPPSVRLHGPNLLTIPVAAARPLRRRLQHPRPSRPLSRRRRALPSPTIVNTPAVAAPAAAGYWPRPRSRPTRATETVQQPAQTQPAQQSTQTQAATPTAQRVTDAQRALIEMTLQLHRPRHARIRAEIPAGRARRRRRWPRTVAAAGPARARGAARDSSCSTHRTARACVSCGGAPGQIDQACSSRNRVIPIRDCGSWSP